MFKLCVLPVLLFLTLSAYGQTVFVNEINYTDPTSIGNGDGVGIAGPAATIIDGWYLVFYNADGLVTRIVNLETKTIPDEGPSHGEVWYDVAMADEPSAFAVVNNFHQLVQFISYGAVNTVAHQVTAIEDIASGLTSNWVGFQIIVSNSLQLVGSGLDYDDFSWATPGGTTPGAVNTGQVFNPSLPIQLISFDVQASKNGHHLTWATSSEINNDYFIVERSADGIHFEDIKKIEGQHSANQKVTYQYLDKTSKTFYYRLRQTDINGANQFSPILYSVGRYAALDIQLFPNPVTHEINVSATSLKEGHATVQMMNAEGKIINTISLEITNVDLQLEVQTLPVGQYFIKIQQGQQIYSGSFLKN